jgi:hypothetical protein
LSRGSTLESAVGSPARAPARWTPPHILVVALLAAIVSAPSLTNGFAYDDVPILRDNPRVHQIATPWSYLTESYWHWSHCCAAYRPVSVWLFS